MNDMKMVLNKCFGGFSIPEELCERWDCEPYDDVMRNHPELVEFVESHDGRYEEGNSCLMVVEFPDWASDWEFNEYDGYEGITYVLNGKLHHV